MPAIITHDTFGQDAYDRVHALVGTTKDEAEAFLLGNQGPDPFFYLLINPAMASVRQIGDFMHDRLPNELLLQMHKAADRLPERDRSIGRAYTLGFLGHYALDSMMHPLVYYNQYAICDAGVEDLTREDGSEVHAVIEREFDELVLTANRGETVATYNPSVEILRGSQHMLDVVSYMLMDVTLHVYGVEIPRSGFSDAVLAFRFVQKIYYSRSGTKIDLIGGAEEKVRRYSIYKAMSHRAILRETSDFDNHEHAEWEDPFTGEVKTDSFWTIYKAASEKYDRAIDVFCSDAFDIEGARAITGGLNFGGQPVE